MPTIISHPAVPLALALGLGRQVVPERLLVRPGRHGIARHSRFLDQRRSRSGVVLAMVGREILRADP